MNRGADSDLVVMFESDRAFVEQQLKQDSTFLKELEIMDYSLLLCIEKRDERLRTDTQEEIASAGASQLKSTLSP